MSDAIWYSTSKWRIADKARLVVGGHMTMAPATITYDSVVSRKTVRITLMIATFILRLSQVTS